MKTVEFSGTRCEVVVTGNYADGHPVLRLQDAQGPLATATVHVNGLALPPDQVLICDWGANAGLLAVLSAAKIVRPIGRTVPLGYVSAHVCQLNRDGLRCL